MFTPNHFIWLGIIAVIIIVVLVLLCHFKVNFNRVILVCFIYACVSEVVKIMSVMELLPTVDGGVMPYLAAENLPFHLCSIQTIFLGILVFAKKDGKLYRTLLPFMYVTCIAGALCAVAMPTCFSDAIPASEAFLHVRPYQYFLHHAMLIIVGFYIPLSGSLKVIKRRDMFYTMCILALCAYLGIVFNSLFADLTYTPIYDEAGEVIGYDRVVNYFTNFFFVNSLPSGVPIGEYTTLNGWMFYLLALMGICLVIVVAMQLPIAQYYHNHPEKVSPAGSDLALVGEGSNAPNEDTAPVISINVSPVTEAENKAYVFTKEETPQYYTFTADATSRSLISQELEREQNSDSTPLLDVLTSLTVSGTLPKEVNYCESTEKEGYTLVYINDKIAFYFVINEAKKSINIQLVNILGD